MIHNRYLPTWVHRLANGVLAFLGAASAGTSGILSFRDGSFLEAVSGWLLLLSPAVGVLFALLDPKRVSLVEGLAGEAGYDELDEHRPS
jgi:hypothetical protein